MKKTLVATTLGLACVMSFPAAQAACNWTGQRAGLIGSGAVVGTLVGGPVGTVIGAALGDWLNGSTGECQAPAKVAAVAPANPYANLKPFDSKGVASVYFATGSNMLTSADQNLLSQAASILQTHPNFDLAIIGAADPRGKNGYNNLDLSQRRATAVKNYLTTHENVNVKRVFTKGLGAVKSDSDEAFSKLRVAKLKLVEKKVSQQM